VTESGGPPVERWLRSHASAVAALLILLGLAARLRAARGPFLTPDEALHLEIAGQGSAVEVYRASLNNAHPPLFALLLHFWRGVVVSDWALRLLPVLFGSLFLWAAWAWARRLLGENAALLTLAFLALLPSVVIVSAELRGYALLLCTIAAALAALERGFAESSSGWMLAFGALAALALLSHYAAFRFASAAILYSGVRLAAGPRSRRLVAAWAAASAALGAVALLLVRSHVAHLRGGALEAEARSTWLREAYFQRGEDGPVAFVWRQTLSLVHYVFSSTAAGMVALGLFLFGVALLVRSRRPAAVLLALPLALAAAGGLLAVYPYAGTRHSIDLALFLCAGVGVGLSRLTGERRWAALVVAAALAPAAFFAAG
jgi:hypothetical protein